MLKKTAIATAMALTLGVGSAQAVSVSTGGTFDMYDPTGALINVDTAITGFVDQDAGTWGVASTNTFYGLLWTASGGTLYTAPGTYTISLDDSATGGVGTAGQTMTFTVGEGQVGGAIKFAWGSTTGIDVVNVWNVNADGSLSYATVPGMIDGPFPGFQASFELTSPGLVSAVPVPAAVWLFGSGLLGLVGVARRKKAA